MLGIDNRGHRVRGCPSPQPDRVCDTFVRNIAGAELAEALAALCAPDFLDKGLGGD
jgi:hypothetical protein